MAKRPLSQKVFDLAWNHWHTSDKNDQDDFDTILEAVKTLAGVANQIALATGLPCRVGVAVETTEKK